MARPIIALLTDFGTIDHYAGTMKGAALTICPDATLVDISHDVPPHDILAGALELQASLPLLPAGHRVPCRGGSRRRLARAGGWPPKPGTTGSWRPTTASCRVYSRTMAPKRVVSLTERRYARPTISRTFEGRDRFAPAAAWLAKGAEVAALGSAVKDYVRLEIPHASQAGDRIVGQVLRVDRFGNLVTNIPRPMVDKLAAGGAIDILADGHPIGTLVETYAGAEPGTPCALFGSSERLEIALNGGDAAAHLGLAAGAVVEVVRPATPVVR